MHLLCTVLAWLALGGTSLLGQDVTSLSPPERAPSPALPSAAPTSLRDLPDDELLAWMGIGVGAWQEKHDSRRPRREVVPAGIFELTPRAAARALVEANLDPWERTVTTVVFDETPPLPKLESGWLLLQLTRSPQADGVYYLPFGKDASACYAFSCPPLGPQEASVVAMDDLRRRWLAETVAWMRRLRFALEGGARDIQYGIPIHPPGVLTSLVERGVKLEEHVSIKASLWASVEAPFPASFTSEAIYALVREAMGLNARPASASEAKLPAILDDAVRTLAKDPKVVAPMLVDVLARLGAKFGREELTPAIEALAGRAQRAYPAERELHKKITQSLEVLRNLSRPLALTRLIGERPVEDRPALLDRLLKVSPSQALALAERAVRGVPEPAWYVWELLERLPDGLRRPFLLKLSSDRRLSLERRKRCEAAMLKAENRANGDPALERALAAFFGDDGAPADVRVDLARSLLYADTGNPPASSNICDALARLVTANADRSEAALRLRSQAALALGSSGDQRAFSALLAAGATGQAPYGFDARLRILTGLAAQAGAEERAQVQRLIEDRLRSREWLREIAAVIWLADLRGLKSAIEPFANWQRIDASVSGTGVGISSDARRLVLTWRETAPLTRAVLDVLNALEVHASYFVERPLLERRIAQIADPLSENDRREVASRAGRLWTRWKSERRQTNDFAEAALRQAKLLSF